MGIGVDAHRDGAFDRVEQVRTIGDITHNVTISLDHSTHEIKSIRHVWSQVLPDDEVITDGDTQCEEGSDVPCSHVSFARDGRGDRLMFTGLRLVGAGGTESCTLDGLLAWRTLYGR